MTAGKVLAGITALLDAVDHDAGWGTSDAGRLELLQAAVGVAGRCTALA